MSSDLVPAASAAVVAARTAAEIRQDVNAVQRILKDIMKPEVHYGVIPGTQKPSLWKPGAEKILSAFLIAVSPEVEDLSTLNPRRVHYRVTCRGNHMGTGVFVGAGVGECSSDEEKYRWRASVHDEEFNNTPETMRRVKYDREGYETQQVRMSPDDVANTVLKMAKKRAMIDLCLTATAASDVFTQDVVEDDDAPGSAPRAGAAVRPAAASANEVVGKVEKVDQRSGKKRDGGTWVKHLIVVAGRAYATFDDGHRDMANQAKAAGTDVRIRFKRTEYGLDVTGMSVETAGPSTPDPTDNTPL